MDNSLLAYIQRLELIGFFSGYALVYATVFFLSGQQKPKKAFLIKACSLLPYTYALAGLLYVGLQLKNIYPDYSLANIEQAIKFPFLAGWATLSVIFSIPAVAKKTYISLLHSLVFFFLFAKDIFINSTASSTDESLLHNDMKIYTTSLLFYIMALATLFLISSLVEYLSNSQRK